jgi:hypothetical protein
MTANELLSTGYRFGALLVHRMVDDLTPAEFLRQPVPGANCAAWVVGHLALTLRNTLQRLGATDLPAFPEELIAKLQVTGQQAGEQTGYGDPKTLVALFDAYVERCQSMVSNVTPAFLAETSDGRPGFAKNRGEGLLFGSLHIAIHTGQLSTIRRCLGKPPVV